MNILFNIFTHQKLIPFSLQLSIPAGNMRNSEDTITLIILSEALYAFKVMSMRYQPIIIKAKMISN